MSKYSWASLVCLKFISIPRNTCMHAQEGSRWALIVQTTSDSTWAQVLRAKCLKPLVATWPERVKMGPEPVSPVTELPCEQWLAHAWPQPWSDPSLVVGRDYKRAGSVRKLRPNHTFSLERSAYSYGLVGLWKVRFCLWISPAKPALRSLQWLTGLKWWLFLFHNRPQGRFISGMWKIKCWLHKVSEICRKHSKRWGIL